MKGRVTVDRIRYDRSHNRKTLGKRILRHWELYLFLVPALVYIIVMNYGPMYGVLIAFQDYKPRKGMSGSEWVGLKHFIRLFGMANFGTYMKNTMILSFYSLLAGFPLPIVLALAMNSSRHRGFAKVVQTATYAPHFISMVVVVSMINVIFAPTTGIVSSLLNKLGIIHGPLTTLMTAEAFPHLYVWSGVWQSLGWDSIIYMGALSSVDDSLHEAALIDGATKWQRIVHIDFAMILPTIVVMLILRSGSILSVGFEKAFLMQNDLNLARSEIISTYTYKMGISQGQYSFSSALGLFNSVINFAMVMLVNFISRKVTETSLW